jgi:hypothetical protein
MTEQSKEPKVYIGMPTYLITEPCAIMGAMSRASEVPGRTVFQLLDGGFHCGNFNALWCSAWNACEEGNYTHHAQIHQDIDPQRLWLDKAITLMDAHDLNVLSVVVPQKQDTGVTSTAVLDKDTLRTRRLCMKEIGKWLPPTFQTVDLQRLGFKNHLLLMSGGMFIAKIGPWFQRCWFEAPARILKDENGKLVSAVWDEGWNWTIQLAQMGVRYACTTEIVLGHVGKTTWSNRPDWGEWETDVGEVDQSWILGKCAKPEETDGWKPRKVLEA